MQVTDFALSQEGTNGTMENCSPKAAMTSKGFPGYSKS